MTQNLSKTVRTLIVFLFPILGFASVWLLLNFNNIDDKGDIFQYSSDTQSASQQTSIPGLNSFVSGSLVNQSGLSSLPVCSDLEILRWSNASKEWSCSKEADPIWDTDKLNYANLDKEATINANWTNNLNPWSDSEVQALSTGSIGSILYKSNNGWKALAPGSSGQILLTNGVNLPPAWSDIFGSNSSSFARGSNTITILSGTGLTGGGSITLGNGGALTLSAAQDINVTSSPVFAGLRLTSLTGVLRADGSGNIFGSSSTTNMPEGSNLYFTDQRSRDAISAEYPLLYNPSSGVLTFDTDILSSGGILTDDQTLVGYLRIAGTGGGGFLNLVSQSSTPATPASGLNLFANSSSQLTWRGVDDYLRTFDSSGLSANQTYTLPNLSGTIALANSSSAGYVLKSGDTMTGGLSINGSTDQAQLLLMGNDTQTANIFEVQNSESDYLAGISNVGFMGLGGTVVDANNVLKIATTFSDPLSAPAAIRLDPSLTITSNNSTGIYGLRANVTVDPNEFNVTGGVRGLSALTTATGIGGLVSSLQGISTQVSNTGDAIVSAGYGLRIISANNSGGGTIGSLYGLYIENQNAGDASYSIYTNTGLNRLGDQLAVEGSSDRVQFILKANTSQTNNLLEIQDPGNNPLTVISSNGSIGIGDTSPLALLTVGDGDLFQVDETGAIIAATGITTSGTVTLNSLTNCASGLQTNSSGEVSCISSDQNLKQNISTLSNSLNLVTSLRGVSYNWLDTNSYGTQTEYGLIAQEVEQVVPQLVFSMGNGYKGVKYQQLTGLIVEAIKEQQNQINNLKSLVGLNQNNSTNFLTANDITAYFQNNEINSLKAANINSSVEILAQALIVKGNAQFLGTTSFEGTTTINGPLNVGLNNAGKATIANGMDSVQISFPNTYSTAPIVNITAIGNSLISNNIQYYINNITNSGFEIHINQSLSEDVEFNWIALGQ